MKKTANIMDKIQPGLDQKVFNGITPRPRVLKFITDEMQKVLTPILGFDPMEFMDLYLTGSLTTYQYSETSDCDVSVFIKWDLWPTGEDPNVIRKKIIPVVMNQLDGTELPGTRHPIQHFVVPPGIEPSDLYKPGLRSAFSFRDHKWLVPPEKDRVHDISVELPVMWHRAKLMEDKMNVLLQVNPIYAKEFWHQIHRKRQQDQKAGLGDFSEGNIVYKMLLHDGYFDRIRDELGEKIAKTADWEPGFSMDRYNDDNYVPPVGTIWTISDPWAYTRNPPGPPQRTVEVTGNEGFYIWYRDLDTQTGTDMNDGISLRTWNEWMANGRIRMKGGDWSFQESPEEGAENWPDTLPENWSKVADDLSWVDKSTPYGTPDGGAVTGPEHWGDDSIDLPSEPGRDIAPPDNLGLKDPQGSLKVIYDFERDQIILGDVRKADQFPPGQIIGDYRDGDVYLNSHAEAWFNANYFKRLWQHSFPKRPIRHVILDKGNGQHEVVHREPTSAILGTHEAHEEDQAGLEERRQGDGQAQPEGAELLQVTSVEEYGEYYWPEPHEIMQAGVDAVEATGQPHPGFRQNAEAAIDSARGAAINRHIGMFGMGGSNDPYELAGHLIWRLQATQMAIDGNKRMATTTGLSWLSMHGYDVTHLPQDNSLYQTVEASSTMNEDEGPELIANYLRKYVTPEDDA